MPQKTKEARQAYNSEYYAAHREQLNLRRRARYAKDCEPYRERSRDYYKDHPGASKERHREYQEAHREETRITSLKHRYGLTIEEATQLSIKSKIEVCALCGNLPSQRPLVVDHDHVTGKVCGLLCDKCNLGLGHFKHSSILLSKAIEYNDRTRGGK